jgi:lambda family phage portal protein
MNLLDRAIAYVAPGLGAQRARHRLRIGAASGYQAAKRELAALRNLTAHAQTADADALPNLETIRARSRALIMNAPLAGGAVGTVVTNVVGSGLRLSPQADGKALAALAGITPEQVKAFEEAAEREWRMFCRAEHADTAGELSFAQIQELAFRSVLGSGDCFAAVVSAPRGGPFDFALQLWEADRVGNPNFRADSNTLAGGVERDEAGRPIAYHVAEINRTTSTKHSWRRVARLAPDGSPRVLHLVHRERIGQSRGVPYLAPVMAALADLDRYTQAEITAAVLNASIAILGESPTGDSPLKNEAAAAGAGTNSVPGFRRANIDFEPGMVLEGFMPGESIKSFDATRPNQGFDPFVQAVLRQVGARLGLPFEVLVLHFTASYSAARAALLQAWAFFRARRAWLAASLCQPTYELVLRNAILRRRLVAPGFLADPAIRAAWCGARWTGPSPGQIDPLKEVKAAEMRLALTLSSRTRETAELTGDDWEQIAAENAEEAQMLRQLGIPAAQLGHNGGPPIDQELPEANPDAPEPDDLPDQEAA